MGLHELHASLYASVTAMHGDPDFTEEMGVR